MRFKKIIILFILTLVLSGCTIYYNINIDESLNINEEIKFKYDNLNFEGENAPINRENFDKLLNNIKKDAYDNKYNFIDESEGSNIKYTLKKSSSFSNFSDPVFLEGKYEKFKTNCNDKFCSISASVVENSTIGEGDLIYLNIGITVPYEVISHNAHDVDEDKNTYYWNYSAIGDQDNIEIVFRKSGKNIVEINQTKNETKKILWVIIGLSIISIIVFIGFKVNKANKVSL